VAGILKLAGQDFFKPQDSVVCIITGHGLKDPETAISVTPTPAALPTDKKAVANALGLS
jgi:threonine synthase